MIVLSLSFLGDPVDHAVVEPYVVYRLHSCEFEEPPRSVKKIHRGETVNLLFGLSDMLLIPSLPRLRCAAGDSSLIEVDLQCRSCG